MERDTYIVAPILEPLEPLAESLIDNVTTQTCNYSLLAAIDFDDEQGRSTFQKLLCTSAICKTLIVALNIY